MCIAKFLAIALNLYNGYIFLEFAAIRYWKTGNFIAGIQMVEFLFHSWNFEINDVLLMFLSIASNIQTTPIDSSIANQFLL